MTPENIRITPDLYASKGKRFLNYIIDRVVFLAFLFAFSSVSALIIYNVFTDTDWFDQLLYDMENVNGLVDRVISAVIFMILYAITEIVLRGKTIGKFATKTLVVMEDGSKPKPVDIILRSLCRLIPFDAFSYLGDEARGWHDSISNTYVVDEVKLKAKIERETGLELIGKSIED